MFAAIGGIVVLFPLLMLLTLFLYAVDGKHVFFVQKRSGKYGKTFNLIKFKTMKDIKDIHGNLLPDMKRITRTGVFIRQTSLDEIPQLINVLKGDMSLIGPRPLLIQYLPLYNETQKRRHEVRPGITGWAQVNGRNAISWQQKLTLDVWYVDHISFRLDLKIIYLTVIKIFTQKDINSDLHTTMQPFTGNN
jgi:lipopolysaccharide/colanic/teichoic acid biosynthesis glycosyltransferase